MSAQTNVLFGLYNDEVILMDAITNARSKHLQIWDVFTPFPVHGLEDTMGISESRLHITGFIYGAIGFLFAFGFMTWSFTRSWPLIFGGKPYWSVPAFIPIMFEMTVLFAAVGMVVTFYTICGLAPGTTNPTLDDRITDDKFCLAFDMDEYTETEIENLKAFLKESGAEEINTKTI